MSDLYMNESKTRTLSKMVPMWFNPSRQFPASLPEPALKWHCAAHGAVFPKAGALGAAPHAEQKARALHLARPPPHSQDHRMERGCGVAGGSEDTG